MFKAWPVVEFAKTIGATHLAMLAAFLDDTGTHAGSQAVGIFGMLGPTAEWTRYEQPWKKHLRETGVSWFHAVDCDNRKKEFQAIERDGRFGRDALVRNLIGVLGDRRCFIVGAAVMRQDWNDVMPEEVKERWGGEPFYFCFEHCMQQIAKWANNNANGEPVALVFAEQEEYQDTAEIIHSYYRRSRYFESLGSFSTAKPKCVIPLQAADLVAYESFIHLRSKVTQHPMRWQLLELLHSGVDNISQFHNRETLAAMLASGKVFTL